MRKVSLFATALVCACSSPSYRGGLEVRVVRKSGAKATCADVRVNDTSGIELGKAQYAFGALTEFEAGIGSKGFPDDVVVTVQARWSSSATDGCSGAVPNGAVLSQDGHFPNDDVQKLLFDPRQSLHWPA